MPRKLRPFASPRSIGVATPLTSSSHASSASFGIPVWRQKSLPLPPGRTPITAPGVCAAAAATAPCDPVARERHGKLAGREGLAGQVAGVLEAARQLGTVLQPERGRAARARRAAAS